MVDCEVLPDCVVHMVMGVILFGCPSSPGYFSRTDSILNNLDDPLSVLQNNSVQH